MRTADDAAGHYRRSGCGVVTAALISLAEAREQRGQPQLVTIRVGARVRYRVSGIEGTVMELTGAGTLFSPVRALVQFADARRFVPLILLEPAR